MSIRRIALVGFGEVGQILGADLWHDGVEAVTAWDLKFEDPESGPALAIAQSDVRAGANAFDASNGADLVISAVTAAQTLEAARSVAPGLKSGSFYLDFNSASPNVKRASAEIVDGAGARYVEAAVMAPVPPKRLATPILLGGRHAAAFKSVTTGKAFVEATAFSEEVGPASAAKMCRSIIVKGLESLLAESLLTGRVYGVDEVVLASLPDLFPGLDWPRLAPYMIGRSVRHGVRRAEEMCEAARTVEDAGLDGIMSAATAERQSWAAQFASAAADEDLPTMLDSILKGLPTEPRTGAR